MTQIGFVEMWSEREVEIEVVDASCGHGRGGSVVDRRNADSVLVFVLVLQLLASSGSTEQLE